MTTHTLEAGAAKTEITPPLGTVTEYGAATEIDLPLYSRALVLSTGGTAVAISTNDLIFIDRETVEAARHHVEHRTGIPGSHILFCASHTHEGPVTYQGTRPDALADRVSDALCQAWDRRVPARLGAAKGAVVGIAINRRNPYGPIDPDVGVIKVERADGKPLALLLNFACHGVVLGHRRYHGISPDYPGHAAAGVETLLGEDTVALFANGACANLNPYTSVGYTGFTNRGGTVTDAARIGRLLALEAVVVADQIQTTPEARLAAASRMLPLGTRDQQSPRQRFDQLIADRTRARDRLHAATAPPSQMERLDRDLQYLNEYYEALLEAAKRAQYLQLDMGVTNPENAEVQVLALNDIRLVGLPGECFTEFGLAIKERALALGFGNVLVAELANGGWWGYIPTPVALEELGYEALNALVFAGLAPHAGPSLVDAAVELLAAWGVPRDPPPRPFIKRPLPDGAADAIPPLATSRVDRLQDPLAYHHEARTRRLEEVRGL